MDIQNIINVRNVEHRHACYYPGCLDSFQNIDDLESHHRNHNKPLYNCRDSNCSETFNNVSIGLF